MDDATLAAVCIWSEAANQPPEGRRAVARVIRNRMALRYESDGTVQGTVLAPGQFSGFWYSMVGGHYTRDAWTLAQAVMKAQKFLAEAHGEAVWGDCAKAWSDTGPAGTFVGGPQYQKLTAHTVLYLNPKIVKTLPDWATPDKEDAVIFDHTFYHA